MTDKRTEKDLIDEICCNLGFIPTSDKRGNLIKALAAIESRNRHGQDMQAFIKGIARNCSNFIGDIK